MTGRGWPGLLALLAAMLMNLLDATVINVAAPPIRADLGGSYASLQWVAAAYTLALAAGLLTGGRLGDLYGRRRMLLIGVAGFVAASALCAAAWSPESLIVARVLQGLSGAVLIPQCFGLIRDLFPPERIGRAFAALGPVIGLATIAGPIVAGLLIEADLFGTGWRMIFLINVPLGACVLAAGPRVLPAAPTGVAGSAGLAGPAGPAGSAGSAEPRPGRLDPVSVLLGGAGMIMLVYPLIQGRELGWPLWVLALPPGAIAVLAWFAVRQVRRKRDRLVELSVFTKRSYTAGVLFVLVFFCAIVGATLVVGLFLQLGLGYSPIRASLTMAGWAVGAFAGTAVAASAGARVGRTFLQVGLVVMALGVLWLWAVFTRAGDGISGWEVAWPLTVFGAGMGMIFTPLFDIIMAGVDDHEVGSASGILESFQQLGASLGIAALATVYFGVIGAQAHHGFDTVAAPRLRAGLAAAGLPEPERRRIVAAARACVHDRENATDPDDVPASCRDAGRVEPGIASSITAAAADVHERGSLAAAARTVQVTLGLTVPAFFLAFLLPKKARPQG